MRGGEGRRGEGEEREREGPGRERGEGKEGRCSERHALTQHMLESCQISSFAASDVYIRIHRTTMDSILVSVWCARLAFCIVQCLDMYSLNLVWPQLQPIYLIMDCQPFWRHIYSNAFAYTYTPTHVLYTYYANKEI